MTLKSTSRALLILALMLPFVAMADETPPLAAAVRVNFQWNAAIPMRDGVRLHALLYTPRDQKAPAPCIFTLTPYIAQTYHDRGVYFAAHGFPFAAVDVRGRGDSEGHFEPFIQEAKDGYDVVEWLAQQPYCNGKVAMSGGSYTGYDQWATAKELPPHLATIVPTAAPFAGVDFPMRGNIFYPYLVQWLNFTGGHALQDGIAGDASFWVSRYREWFESGSPFNTLDTRVGNPSAVFQQWLAHPTVDAFWDRYNPTAEQYAKLAIPILTITGSYDDDQPGAIAHYREYMKSASPEGRARHYLVIGPWDHAGTHAPKAEFGGLTFGAASLVDLLKLHVDWYGWAMQAGPKPVFLKKNVAYYVMRADTWRYADTLEGVTAESRAYYLDSATNATDVLSSGSLGPKLATGKPDHYEHDARDLSPAALEATLDPASFTSQSLIYARRGKQLVYHSAPFEKDTEVSGFFTLSAWLSIDQPDTDFSVSVYEIRKDGGSILLTSDLKRARYRESAREAKLITTRKPQRYDFKGFTFTSRRIEQGSRLRLVIAPVNSIYSQKNYNSGVDVSAESMQDARVVTVTLYHDRAHSSALFVPMGQKE
ncbi:MAG: CocE/NonD family hydrolase [Gammaproteobacteria bacterium]